MLLNLWVQGLIFVSLSYNPVLTAESTLQFLIVLARHGDRRPDPMLESYPTDPHKNKNFDGKLTEAGQKRELDLGIFLRTAYNDFLGPTYVPGCIAVSSTDVNRTKESANFILKGLYPEAVIPVTSKLKMNDDLFFPQLCLAYVVNYLAARVDSAGQLKKFNPLMKKLSKWTGKSITSALDMYLLYMTFDAEKFMNLELPPWTNGIYPDGDLLKGALLELHIMNYNKAMRNRNGGKLINKFKKDMKSVKSGKMDKNRKLILYVAHDLNIVAVLKALGVFDPHVPKYSSSLIFELHLIDKTYHVKVNYYLGVPAEMKPLQIPKCEISCPLDQFSKLMKDVIPYGLDSMCDKMRGFEILAKVYPDTAKKFKQLFS